MKTIKKITSVIAISFAILAGSFAWGGVESKAAERISPSEMYRRWGRLIDYVCAQQPRQVRQDIRKTVSSYKKKGKKYKDQSSWDYVQKRFKMDNFELTGPSTIPKAREAHACMDATEKYLLFKINGTKPNFEDFQGFERGTYYRLYGGK